MYNHMYRKITAHIDYKENSYVPNDKSSNSSSLASSSSSSSESFSSSVASSLSGSLDSVSSECSTSSSDCDEKCLNIDSLQYRVESIRPTLLKGIPGSGKSFVIKHIVNSCISKELQVCFAFATAKMAREFSL